MVYILKLQVIPPTTSILAYCIFCLTHLIHVDLMSSWKKVAPTFKQRRADNYAESAIIRHFIRAFYPEPKPPRGESWKKRLTPSLHLQPCRIDVRDGITCFLSAWLGDGNWPHRTWHSLSPYSFPRPLSCNADHILTHTYNCFQQLTTTLKLLPSLTASNLDFSSPIHSPAWRMSSKRTVDRWGMECKVWPTVTWPAGTWVITVMLRR